MHARSKLSIFACSSKLSIGCETFFVSPGPGDYSPTTATFTFTPANAGSRQCVVIPITDDMVVEDDELFSCRLTTTDPAVDLDPQEAAAIIHDDDGKF